MVVFWGKLYLNIGEIIMKKYLFFVIVVLVVFLLVYVDLKVMDDGVLFDVIGQVGISIFGIFQGFVGVVIYIDIDINGGFLWLENISLLVLIIDDIKLLIIDVVIIDIGGKLIQ